MIIYCKLLSLLFEYIYLLLLFRIFLSSQSVADKANLTEHYYGTQYSFRDFTQEEIDNWSQTIDAGLHLPKENHFIPKDFTIFGKFNGEPV